MSETILRVDDLTVEFRSARGAFRAVEGITFDVPAGRTVGIVGESGSGKSVTAMSILRLLDPRSASVRGSVTLRGTELLALGSAEMRKIRGAKIAMVFQDPSASLDPSWRIGRQIEEAILVHQRVSRAEARSRALALLNDVGIPAPSERIDAFPHELSGGMKQRAMIAIALACGPDLLIADEPTTALDVTIQAQILDLLKKIQRERGLSIILITHDLGLVAEAAEEIVVMYAGRVVERGHALDVLRAPSHPYTAGLLASTPLPGVAVERLREIPGVVPDLRALPAGCRFEARCSFTQDRCREEEPALVADGAAAHRCHFPLGGPA